jgi:hypothetical protein
MAGRDGHAQALIVPGVSSPGRNGIRFMEEVLRWASHGHLMIFAMKDAYAAATEQ